MIALLGGCWFMHLQSQGIWMQMRQRLALWSKVRGWYPITRYCRC